ncbi:hypothetical protein BDV12DRAFT_202035 [Aspergillus spectabilis]
MRAKDHPDFHIECSTIQSLFLTKTPEINGKQVLSNHILTSTLAHPPSPAFPATSLTTPSVSQVQQQLPINHLQPRSGKQGFPSAQPYLSHWLNAVEHIQPLLSHVPAAQTNFNIFYRHFNNAPKGPNIISGPAPHYPPVEETARKLVEIGQTGRYHHALLLPDKGKKSFSDVLELVRQNLERGVPKLDLNSPEDMRMIAAVDSGLSGVVLARQSDSDKYKIPWLQAEAKKAGMDWIDIKTTVERRAGEDFPSLDVSKTIEPFRNNPERMKEAAVWIHNAMDRYLTEFPSEKEKKNRLGHQKAIRLWKDLYAARPGLIVCSPRGVVPVSRRG